MNPRFLLAISISFALTVTAGAAVVTVSKTGAITTIQAGIDAAAAGDTVRILAGTYAESFLVPLAKPGLIVPGKGKVIVDARGAGGAALGVAVDVSSNGAKIKGLTIRNAAELGFDEGVGLRMIGVGVVVEQCTFEGNEASGIDVIGDDARIRKCSFRSCDRGVRTFDSANTRIEGCAFRACGSAVSLTNSQNPILDKLTIFDGGNKTAIDTISSNPSNGAQVTNCVIRQSGDSAVVLRGAGCRIANVKVFQTAGGISIFGDDAIVENCRVEAAGDGSDGIQVRNSNNFRVSKNVVVNATNSSIVFGLCTNGIVSGNRTTNMGGTNTIGIAVNGTNFTLEDNVASGVRDGFFLEGAGHVVRDCVAKDCGRDGFDLRPSVAGGRFEDCVALRCDAEGFENSGTGTEFVDCVAKQCRLDFANDGTVALAGIVFTTGGANVAPQIE